MFSLYIMHFQQLWNWNQYEQLVSYIQQSDMDAKPEDSIQVCIRIRPGQQQQTIVQFNQSQIHLDKNHFGFDKIFYPNATQQQIFQAVGTKLISHTLDGYNGCVFVYGQTGSGKTYTMIGDNNGLMHQSFIWLFRQIQQLYKCQSSISCSYYQIYNQQIIDLLDTKRQKKLTIRQDMKKGIFIQNIAQEIVYSQHKLLDCLNTGMRNRHVGQTMMNRQSSRSHSIFTISLSLKTQVNGVQVLKTPKLHFVDLAGSQRQKMTAASGERLKQAGNINKSLTTLGMVINALASQKSRTHIPYRDSKLTSLLRDSLGGNSKTFLIATISRNVLCFQETLSTLNFANRAKMVKVKALVNQQSLSTNIETYKQQIRRLKAQIQRLKFQMKTPNLIQMRLPKNNYSVNYDQQFKQINGKISLISQHLCKNPVSPSFEMLLQQIKKLKPQKSYNSLSGQNSSEMIQENTNQNQLDREVIQNIQQQEEDPLIQYLTCNNALLQKINQKVQEYVEMKDHLRSLAYNNQLKIASLKTPSKFQRQQLQYIIEKRNEEIHVLNMQLKQYRKLLAQQDNKYKQVINEARGKSQISQQSIQKYQKQQAELHRQINTLRNLVKKTNQDIEIMNNRFLQVQLECKQNKELYLFAQQNYQTEKALKQQIEKNLLQKINYIELMKVQYTEKLEQQKQYFQQVEQQLKQQLNVLTQTVEFNQNLLMECKLKLQAEKTKTKEVSQRIIELEDNLQKILIQKANLQAQIKQIRQLLQQTTRQMEEMKTMYGQQLSKQINQLQNMTLLYQNIKNQKQNQQKYFNSVIEQNSKQIGQLRDSLQNQVYNSALKLKQYKQSLNQKTKEYQNQVIQIENKYTLLNQQNKQSIGQLKDKLQISEIQITKNKSMLAQKKHQLNLAIETLNRIQQQCNKKINTIYQQTKAKLQQAKILQIENEQMKKQYRILQKDNYKIKSKTSEINNKTQEELTLKVDYYEQKFKLMSIQYQKAVQVVKRLKEKQLMQAEKIAGLEESHKAMKISLQNSKSSNEGSNALKILSHENQQLKKQLQTIKQHNNKQESTQSYLNKVTFQQQKTILKQKEEYFKKKIQQSINRWDPSKQNILKNRTLQQLINCWEQLQSESCKKFEAIAKGIKRQQKLKTQNNLTLKQNIYLKQQLAILQKLNDEQLGIPRKKVKLELTLIPEDSMQ